MGWIKKARDTGWRDVSADLRLGATGVLHIRRVGLHVYWRLRDFKAGTAHAFYAPPAGLALPSSPQSCPLQSPGNPVPIVLDHAGRFVRPIQAAPLATGQWWEGAYLLPPGVPMLADFGTEVP